MAPEHKHVVERAEETNALLAAMVECSDDAIVGEALNGEITYWNEAAERLFGFASDEVVGRPSHCLAPRESIPADVELRMRVTRGERIDRFDTVRVRKDGGTVEVAVTISPIKDAAGRIVGTSRIMRDISARKAALREGEERFRTLADNIAQLAWMADGTGYIFWYNRRWFEYTGTTLADTQGWGWQKVHHPDHVARVVEKIRHAFAAGEYWEDTFPLRAKDGRYRWFLSRAIPIRNAQGEVVRWMGTNTDITEQLDGEMELSAARDRAEKSEKLFRAFVTASSDVVYRMNADWTVMRRLEGKDFISDTPDPSRSWLKNYIHPDDQPRVLAAIDAAIREKKTFELEHRVIRIDGTLGWTFSRAIPLLGERGEINEWFGAAHDITERKEAAAALQRLTENLERIVAERTAKLLETIGELEAFSYSIAHDMRAPLRSLQGYAEVLLTEHAARLDPEGREYLARIGNAANRMDRLILDVLNYSRIVRSELRLERVPLASLLDDILKTYPMFAADKADIAIARPLPTVLGNDAMLTQVFSNLLGNAVKFAAPGRKPAIKVWSELHGPRVRVLVQDNGIGIAEDQHRKIFEVFQQADTRFGGTGIGLAIVRKAVERLGGEVGLRSEPGQGTTFWVELPRAD